MTAHSVLQISPASWRRTKIFKAISTGNSTTFTGPYGLDLVAEPIINTQALADENILVTVRTAIAGSVGIQHAVSAAEFFALMPGDNSATIAPGTPVLFPQAGVTTGPGIVAASSSSFTLVDPGTYRVSWQVSVSEAGQLQLEVGGAADPTTVVGRATGTSQIVGSSLITTINPNTSLRVLNPAGNSTALTITPIAGGTHAVSASLVIEALGVALGASSSEPTVAFSLNGADMVVDMPPNTTSYITMRRPHTSTR